MRQLELRREINRLFTQAGKKDSWAHDYFREMDANHCLAHFHLNATMWFPMADEIAERVDELHTQVTPKEDFLRMAEMAGIAMPKRTAKRDIAAALKAKKDWKRYVYELDRVKREEAKLDRVRPLLAYVQELGYQMVELPVVEADNPHHFTMQVYDFAHSTNRTLHLQVAADNQRIMIQTDDEVIGLFARTTDAIHILTETF